MPRFRLSCCRHVVHDYSCQTAMCMPGRTKFKKLFLGSQTQKPFQGKPQMIELTADSSRDSCIKSAHIKSDKAGVAANSGASAILTVVPQAVRLPLPDKLMQRPVSATVLCHMVNLRVGEQDSLVQQKGQLGFCDWPPRSTVLNECPVIRPGAHLQSLQSNCKMIKS